MAVFDLECEFGVCCLVELVERKGGFVEKTVTQCLRTMHHNRVVSSRHSFPPKRRTGRRVRQSTHRSSKQLLEVRKQMDIKSACAIRCHGQL